MKLAILIASRNRPDLLAEMVPWLERNVTLDKDIIVVECGTDPGRLSPHATLHYADPDFRGKCFGHNLALRYAELQGVYDYYWVLMNDLVFEDGTDPAARLIETMEAHPELGILSPTEPGSSYPAAAPQPGGDWRPVTTCDYLGFMLRATARREAGFLPPHFRYCWGAIHELSHELYRRGWVVGYSDRVTYRHLGGSTYGADQTRTISREEYQRRARRFAYAYFVRRYGPDWDRQFFEAARRHGATQNTYTQHRTYWATAFTEEERAALERDAPRVLPTPPAGTPPLARSPAPAKADTIGAADADPSTLRQRIEALHPWYYPVQIKDVAVTPGVGSRQSAEQLAGRVDYRRRLLVDEVVRRYDFRGKRLLDLASNCSYFGARYVEHGARSLHAVEGREEYMQQGWLYWQQNQFLPEGDYRFELGNVMDEETWKSIREHGPYDFTLCCGILYHIPDYPRLLRQIAMVTHDAILVDTRVAAEEEMIEEPGGWFFDAIAATRVKTVPNQERLVECLHRLGFQVEPLRIQLPTPVGLEGPDDYNAGRRVALLATRR